MRAKTRTTIASALTSTALGAALLTGCGSDGATSASSSMPNVEPAPSGSTSSSSSSSLPSASSSPSTSEQSTPGSSVEMAGAPGVPKKAQKHSKAGAKAFVKHYVDAINTGQEHPDKPQLSSLGSAACQSCADLESSISTLHSQGHHYAGPALSVDRTVAEPERRGQLRVWAQLDQRHVQILDAAGTKTDSVPKIPNQVFVFHLQWTDGGWRVEAIKTSASGMPA